REEITCTYRYENPYRLPSLKIYIYLEKVFIVFFLFSQRPRRPLPLQIERSGTKFELRCKHIICYKWDIPLGYAVFHSTYQGVQSQVQGRNIENKYTFSI